MGKFFVPPTARTPADCVREQLDEVERVVSNLRGTGPRVLGLLHILDQVAEGLAELEAAGVDMRAERVRFETVQMQLRRRQGRLLAEAGAAFQEERAAVRPDRARWWWFLDEAVSQQRMRRLRRWLVGGLAMALLLLGAWWAYDRFVAPPPQVRQAFRHGATGESLAVQGDLQAALAEFEAAAALAPDHPDFWIWQGVFHSQLNEQEDTVTAFETARPLYETDFDFLLERALTYLYVGNLPAAGADAEQAILENPDSGYGYYVRAAVAAEQGDYAAAILDLDRAADLARVAGDARLEVSARAQRATVMQVQLSR